VGLAQRLVSEGLAVTRQEQVEAVAAKLREAFVLARDYDVQVEARDGMFGDCVPMDRFSKFEVSDRGARVVEVKG
jgi:hypothetical protein